MLTPLAHQLPDHRHRRARHGRAADADGHSVLHDGGCVVQGHDLLAQAAIAPGEALSERPIVSYDWGGHPFLLRADRAASVRRPRASRWFDASFVTPPGTRPSSQINLTYRY